MPPLLVEKNQILKIFFVTFGLTYGPRNSCVMTHPQATAAAGTEERPHGSIPILSRRTENFFRVISDAPTPDPNTVVLQRQRPLIGELVRLSLVVVPVMI